MLFESASEQIFAKIDDIEYCVYRQKHFDGLKEVLYKSFFVTENVCIATEVHQSEQAKADLLALSVHALLDGVSIVARDVKTDTIVGICINKIQTPGKPGAPTFFDWFRNERCHCDSSRALIDFMIVLDSKLDLFQYYNANCIFECMFLATMTGYEKRGIGFWMTNFSYEFAQKIGHNEHLDLVSSEVRTSGNMPSIVSAIFTSAFSQKIGKKLKFVEHAVVSFDDVHFDGTLYSNRIQNSLHTSAVVMAKKI